MPVFLDAPEEANIIGRLITGYGELEFDLAMCLSRFTHDRESAFRAMFRVRSEGGRLHIAESLLFGPLTSLGLRNEYTDVKGAMRYCLRIRNQYAHCHWGEYNNRKPYFINMEEEVKKDIPKDHYDYMGVSLKILKDQELYYAYTQNCLWFLSHEVDVKRQKLKRQPFSMPSKLVPPKLHNP